MFLFQECSFHMKQCATLTSKVKFYTQKTSSGIINLLPEDQITYRTEQLAVCYDIVSCGAEVLFVDYRSVCQSSVHAESTIPDSVSLWYFQDIKELNLHLMQWKTELSGNNAEFCRKVAEIAVWTQDFETESRWKVMLLPFNHCLVMCWDCLSLGFFFTFCFLVQHVTS